MAYLTIVIPVYNVAEYVRQCITSVVSQADDAVEVVIVEDHSTDRSYEIVQELVGKHDNVKVVRPERNFGLGEARNLGVAHSTGTYVAFLDSDDYFAPGAIRSILDRCRSTEADVIFYDYARLYWNNRKVRNKMGYLLGLHHDPIRLQDCPDLLKILNIAHNKAYKRSFLNENHLTFPAGYYEDVPFTYPVLCLADSIALLDRVCVMYRQRVKGSILRTADARHMQIIDQVDLLLERFDHDDRLEPWRDEIWDRSANHCVAVLAKGTERLPAELRNEFFDRASAVLARHLPAQHEFPLNSQGLKYRFLVQGDYRSFQTLKLANSYRVKIRNKYRPKIQRALKQARSSPLVLPTIDENLAVFTTMWGREPRGNPLAIAEGLKEWAPKVRAVWLLKQLEVDGLDGTPDYEYVTMGSDDHKQVMKAAKFFVNDVNFPNSLLKREGQVHLQTQHGTPLKFMGMDMQAYPVAANHMNFWNLLGRIKFWDFDLSSNRYSTEILARAFPGNHEILEFGYPRNDVLVNPPKGMASDVRNSLGVSDESFCVLYTPTYRDGYTEFDLDLDPEAVLGALGANATLLIRGHHSYRDTSSAERLTEEGRIIDVTDWPEVAPLYLASDLLICDYSSTMFDFAILGRPIVIYAPDWKRYRTTRGTYFDILAEPPGATAQSMEQLVGVLSDREFDSDESQELLRVFRGRFCEFDDGDATERVIKRVFLGESPEPPVSRFDEPRALSTWNLTRPG
ncbi:MAG: bifunctional glycosyltransferase family 2 protein/CDP-glycerol:glycerophosphate glycerophosphotransferase [Candidatus Microthrix sp.]|nr:bifunctional glycosyltransferase family 2 protein/CDP-glycerol:glycerophosphate glycerophosphotransferase [Candidatus Microthrix sp.]MBK7321229.1 bifunctional glycosyltransferase family 2 protein/CDP-glycerol:glycerophosphate glycerophosphotransferase [Candidatus Microthrix sp.]